MHRTILVLLALAVPAAPRSATLRVPGDFPSVTEAVRAAGPGDRIEVAPGTYSPSITGEELPLVFSGGDLEVRGAGAGRSVLHAERGSAILVFRDGDVSRVSDFALAGGLARQGGAITVESASPELERLCLAGNEAHDGGDALAVLGGEPRVTNCLFERNGEQGPTILVRAGVATFEHNTLHANAGASFRIHGDASPIIRSTIVSRPGERGGRAVGIRILTGAGFGAPILEDNLFAGCFEGTVAIEGDSEDILRSLLEDARRAGGLREGDPLFVDADGGDFRLRSTSPARGFTDPETQIGAFGGPDPLRATAMTPEWRERVHARDSLLGPSVPNPFAPATTIHFTVRDAGVVDLGVYNVLGQRVRTLHSGDLTAGEHTRVWDGRDEAGVDLPPGIYFVRVTQAQVTESSRLVLLR